MSEPFELYKTNLNNLTNLIEKTFNQFDELDGTDFKITDEGMVKSGKCIGYWIDGEDSKDEIFVLDKRIILKGILNSSYKFAIKNIMDYLYAVHTSDCKSSA
jgi:hypothetical protein